MYMIRLQTLRNGKVGDDYMNINEEYIEEYIRSITPENCTYLKKLEDYAKIHHVPIIEPETAQLIKVLLKNNKPKNILEVGTAIGYSALIMAEATPNTTKITTIERNEEMIELANNNISNSEFKDRIRIISGDAEDVLPHLNEAYDFIFLDAAKGQYLDFFNYCKTYLENGGLIVSDNVLFKGMVASDDLVVKRKKTIVTRLRAFLKYINELEGYTSCVIPIGDGVALTYKEV